MGDTTRTYIVPDGQDNNCQMLPWMAMMNGGMGGFGGAAMWNNPLN